MKNTDTIANTRASCAMQDIGKPHRIQNIPSAAEHISHLNCLRENEHYRNTIMHICRDCFYKAETREQFAIMMATIETVVSSISAYPKIDEELIRGAALALLAVGRWEE